MAHTSSLRILYLSYFSKPVGDRPIYRAIRRQKATRILEIGVGMGRRATRMIEVAARFAPVDQVQYTAMDRFEDRSAVDGPGITLRMAYRLFGATGAQLRLIPGEPFAGLAREANAIGQIDLAVISSRQDEECLARAWLYLPRMLNERSEVFMERILPGGEVGLRSISHDEISSLAGSGLRRAA